MSIHHPLGFNWHPLEAAGIECVKYELFVVFGGPKNFAGMNCYLKVGTYQVQMEIFHPLNGLVNGNLGVSSLIRHPKSYLLRFGVLGYFFEGPNT